MSVSARLSSDARRASVELTLLNEAMSALLLARLPSGLLPRKRASISRRLLSETSPAWREKKAPSCLVHRCLPSGCDTTETSPLTTR